MEAGAAFGLDIRDPTRDRRLIEYCWRVPNEAFWAGGLQRGLIRKGMADLLPAVVRQCERRGLQAADVGHRVLAERSAVAHALGRIERHALASAAYFRGLKPMIGPSLEREEDDDD